MRAVGVIIRAGRNQLNRVRTEDGQIPHVLVPSGDVPAIVGICFGTITELVAAQTVARCRGDVHIIAEEYLAASHVQSA